MMTRNKGPGTTEEITVLVACRNALGNFIMMVVRTDFQHTHTHFSKQFTGKKQGLKHIFSLYPFFLCEGYYLVTFFPLV